MTDGRITKRGSKSAEDGGPVQEIAHILVLLKQHFLDQIIDNVSVAATEGGDKTGYVPLVRPFVGRL